MANEIIGAKKYLCLASEDLWGSNPFDSSGSGSAGQEWVHVPALDFNVRFRPEMREANPFLGIFQRKHAQKFRGMPSGQLTCALHGFRPPGLSQSLAEYLMTWAFDNHESTDLPSKTAFWAEGPNVANKEFTGLRVNQATLVGSEESGTCVLTLDLMGKADEAGASAPSLPSDREKIVDFDYSRSTFTLGGSAILLKNFQIQIQHALQVHYLNTFTPSLLVKMDRVVTVQMTPIKNSATYDAYRRLETTTELVGQINLQGNHNGTGSSGNYTKVQIDFPRLVLMDVDEQGGRNDLATQPLSFAAKKPDTSSNDMSMTWSEVA